VPALPYVNFPQAMQYCTFAAILKLVTSVTSFLDNALNHDAMISRQLFLIFININNQKNVPVKSWTLSHSSEGWFKLVAGTVHVIQQQN